MTSRKDSECSQSKETNVWGDRYANDPGLIITHCTDVIKYHTISHKCVWLLFTTKNKDAYIKKLNLKRN